jgi:hypothetical protein
MILGSQSAMLAHGSKTGSSTALKVVKGIAPTKNFGTVEHDSYPITQACFP